MPSKAEIRPVPEYFNQALSQWNGPDIRSFPDAEEKLSKNTRHVHGAMGKPVL